MQIAPVRARRRIVDHFCFHHALDPEDAIEFVPQSLAESREFDRMRAQGVIGQRAPGHYWLDLGRHNARVERRRRRLVPFVIVAALAIAWALTLFYRG